MMPELGKYASAVLSAYGITILLVLVLIGWSILRGRKVHSDLKDVEARKEQRNG